MSRIHLMAITCSLAGVLAILVAPPARASRTLAVYKLSEKTVHCPAKMHAEQGCVELTGKALTAGRWPRMHRVAAVGASVPGLRPGCVTADTRGTLSGSHGVLRFTGTGYYCPRSNTARYRLRFDPADARRFGLPLHGAIRYRGKTNSETFTAVPRRPNRNGSR